MRSIIDNNQQAQRQRLTVKLKTRWQDTILVFRERMKIMRQIQKEQRKLAKLRANAARISVIKSDNYSIFVKNIRGRVGHLSSIAISNGKRNIISHYNAKKRVYLRQKTARQLARKVVVEGWKERYTLRESRWGWLRGNAIDNTTTTTWWGVTLTEPSHASWFDNEGYPLTSRDPETGRYVNPWLSESSNGENGLKNFLRWKLGGAWSRFLEAVGLSSNPALCQDDVCETNEKTHYVKTLTRGKIAKSSDSMNLHESSTASDGKLYQISTTGGQSANEAIRLTWIGHSTTVVTFPGDFTILTDPHFSNYAGPVRRTAPPAFGVADLPEVVDCVLISHDHMDHLDYWSILELIESKKVSFWVVPLGIKSWLMDKAGISSENIVELEWWQGVRLSKPLGGKHSNRDTPERNLPEVVELVRAFDEVTGQHPKDGEEKARVLPDKNELVITCAPAQHWCSRSPFDRNQRLWCSFSVHATPALAETGQRAPRTHSFYFAGDSGLPTDFPLHHQIGDRLGPFDISAIPIGAYEPEWFMRESHCNPAEAVKIHQAIRSRRSVAVHFDTFDLADEPREEPPTLLLAEVERVNEDILNMAAEVVAVADIVGIAAAQLGKEIMKDATSLAEQLVAGKRNEELIGILPPLVDFAVIKRGQSIESLPK
jgi:N-acyl-phosphatidylethanolamine-hydrolysing phospholipase D